MSPFKLFIVLFTAGWLVNFGYWFIFLVEAPKVALSTPSPPRPLSFLDVGSWMFGPTSTVSIPALWKGKCRPLRDDDLTHFLLNDKKVNTTAVARGQSKTLGGMSYRYVYVFSNWCIQTFGRMHPAVRWAKKRTAKIHPAPINTFMG